ncbi:MAG: NAD(P)-dependent dehydrogenase (short-subunit alcohol dehydrogenase family) [Polaribacter sp.]|jgi:NAD(P)-dependent dehydrogenase (short-subunit alcohol dehydrogenase family)
MLARFTQKRVLVTGGASGLGKAIVMKFAKLGWKIAVVDINIDGAKQVAEEANCLGANAIAFYCDVGKDEDFVLIAKDLKDQWSGLDIIVNNAGVATTGMMVDCSPEQWDRAINLNLNSVYRGCNYWLPLINQDGPGHVVNTASAAGLMKAPSMMSYNVSKAGVVALSETLYAELAYRNIGVSVICPAFFKTNLLDSLSPGEESLKPLIKKWMENSKITADDVANDVLNGIEKNKLMVISHDYARKAYRFKRFFPMRFIKGMSKKVPQIIASKQKQKQNG